MWVSLVPRALNWPVKDRRFGERFIRYGFEERLLVEREPQGVDLFFLGTLVPPF